MSVEIVTIACLSDNYAFLIHEDVTGDTVLVDAPEAAPIQAELDNRGWTLSTILLTHHHSDHIDGVADLVRQSGARTVGAAPDAHRLPKLDQTVIDGDTLELCGETFEVWDVSGHTVGHVAFIVRGLNAAFTADSLMALGCGRVFEGTMDQMWASLSKFSDLPDDTLIYSGHEYTAANGNFAVTIEPQNEALKERRRQINEFRSGGRPTVPSSLGLERATNPFLRASDPTVKVALGMPDAPDSEVFAEIRRRKDRF